MKEQGFVGVSVMLMVLMLTSGLALSAEKSATLATHAVGSMFNAVGTGIASVVSRRTPILVRVQPFAGPPAWLPSMEKGETDMGILTSADAALSSKGMMLYKRPYKNSRLLTAGGAIYLSFYVVKDSPIETVADLKGKRVPTDFPGIPIARLSSTAVLATAGLTYADIVRIPVSDLAAAAQAFLEGRSDTGWTGVGAPAVEEADARKGGVKFVSVVSTSEAAKRMAEMYPGSYPGILKAGSATGIVKDTTLLANDIYLVATKDMTEELAYEIVKSLWNYNEELGAAHPALKAWKLERMVSERATVPYHPGAIKFFREKGAWTKEMDTLQAKLMGE